MRSVHNRGEYQGVEPDGTEIELSSITLERIEDGKIVERRVAGDWLGMMQQLGLVP
jgi:predicted ester cyclase